MAFPYRVVLRNGQQAVVLYEFDEGEYSIFGAYHTIDNGKEKWATITWTKEGRKIDVDHIHNLDIIEWHKNVG
jgi:hypothetical protein